LHGPLCVGARGRPFGSPAGSRSSSLSSFRRSAFSVGAAPNPPINRTASGSRLSATLGVMKLMSRIYTVEALLCAGSPTLLAPLLVAIPVVLPMELAAASSVFLVAIACVAAMFAYWQLALATIDRKKFKFGWVFWLGTAGAAFVTAALLLAASGTITLVSSTSGQFWLLVISPTLLSAGHFIYLQLQSQQASAALQP